MNLDVLRKILGFYMEQLTLKKLNDGSQLNSPPVAATAEIEGCICVPLNLAINFNSCRQLRA
jgi:hypothetical protein